MKEYLRQAEEKDISEVVSLYSDAVGREGCTWNEYYPTRDDAWHDFERGCLYVFVSDGKIVGAVSVVPENELDSLECWKINDSCREIARVTVSKELSGKGLGAKMVGELLSVLKDGGCRAVHILAAKRNAAALKTYKKLGFEFVGECFMYGNDYFAAEKIL